MPYITYRPISFDHVGVGKSRFTVVSTQNTELFLYYYFFLYYIVFHTNNCKLTFAYPCVRPPHPVFSLASVLLSVARLGRDLGGRMKFNNKISTDMERNGIFEKLSVLPGLPGLSFFCSHQQRHFSPCLQLSPGYLFPFFSWSVHFYYHSGQERIKEQMFVIHHCR